MEKTTDITKKLKTLKDVFDYHKTTQEEFDNKWKGFQDHEKFNALEVLIVEAYNENKLPDFTDGTLKYWPYFKMGSPSGDRFSYYVFDFWFTFSGVGSRLCFHGDNAKKNMLDAVAKFLPEYKKSRTS